MRKEIYPGNDFSFEEPIERVAWNTRDAAEELNIEEAVLRMYVEKLGMKVSRSKGKKIVFRKPDILYLRKFVDLLNGGLSLKGALRHIDKADQLLPLLS